MNYSGTERLSSMARRIYQAWYYGTVYRLAYERDRA